MANNHITKCTASLIINIREMQIETLISSHIGQNGIIKKSVNNKWWRGYVKEKDPTPHTVGGNVDLYSHCEKQFT